MDGCNKNILKYLVKRDTSKYRSIRYRSDPKPDSIYDMNHNKNNYQKLFPISKDPIYVLSYYIKGRYGKRYMKYITDGIDFMRTYPIYSIRNRANNYIQKPIASRKKNIIFRSISSYRRK